MNINAHTIYKLKDNTRVPSVTTIVGLLDKSKFLVPWANRLGLQGIDSSKYVDALAEVGTLAHQMILDYFKKVETDFSDYSPETRDKAENSFLSFLEWAKGKDIEPLALEIEAVSESLRFGGKFDFYGLVNGIKTLIDFKTGSGIYDEMGIQLSAYRYLLIENNLGDPEQCMIVRIPRDETETFEVKSFETKDNFEIFKRLLEIYYLQRKNG
ncbi:MAG: PD-(D/E)XK nuclease family protein [Ignavibacteriales bacterium]|nr:PD-(D/E)XK nuclease family protein [Ignavibacteriales bacterium]